MYQNLVIGDDCYIGRDCIFDLQDTIKIGDRVTISHRATLNTHTDKGKANIAVELNNKSSSQINIEDDVSKYETIKDLFSSLSIAQAIIYCNSTRRVDDLCEAMISDQFPVKKIHGRMGEDERKATFSEIKIGS